MKISKAIELLSRMDPDADLVVALDLDEDLKPGERKTFVSVVHFTPVSVDTETYIDSIELVEKNGYLVEVRF